jgi:hypothetical protein
MPACLPNTQLPPPTPDWSHVAMYYLEFERALMKTTLYTSSSEKSPAQHRHDSPLVKLLLRNYANNLRRSWRNTSHAAFIDATIQVEALVTLALAIFLMLIETLVSRTFLPSLSLPVGNTKYGRGMAQHRLLRSLRSDLQRPIADQFPALWRADLECVRPKRPALPE